MGAFLEKPAVEKENASGSGTRLTYAMSSMQGWRSQMEVKACHRALSPMAFCVTDLFAVTKRKIQSSLVKLFPFLYFFVFSIYSEVSFPFYYYNELKERKKCNLIPTRSTNVYLC